MATDLSASATLVVDAAAHLLYNKRLFRSLALCYITPIQYFYLQSPQLAPPVLLTLPPLLPPNLFTPSPYLPPSSIPSLPPPVPPFFLLFSGFLKQHVDPICWASHLIVTDSYAPQLTVYDVALLTFGPFTTVLPCYLIIKYGVSRSLI